MRRSLCSMALVRHEQEQHQLRLHRFAVRLYETLVERYGIHHEQAELALRLVQATNPDGREVVVSVPNENVRMSLIRSASGS